MTLYRSLSVLGAAAALTATSVQAQQAKSCDIDESKPKEVATANFMIQQARGLQPLQKKVDALKKVVKRSVQSSCNRCCTPSISMEHSPRFQPIVMPSGLRLALPDGSRSLQKWPPVRWFLGGRSRM